MSIIFTEESYENSVIELFEEFGYSHVYGPDIERDFYSPLYNDVLTESLRRINPNLPEDAISDAVFKLKNIENGELADKNQVFMDYLQTGVPVKYMKGSEETSGLCYLVDYENADNNSFIVANQSTAISENGR